MNPLQSHDPFMSALECDTIISHILTAQSQSKYGDDEELRYAESNAIRSYIDGLIKHGPKVGKWTKKTLAEYICVGGLGFTPVGTPKMVADEMEQWCEVADVDGFNIVSAQFTCASLQSQSQMCDG